MLARGRAALTSVSERIFRSDSNIFSACVTSLGGG